MSLRTRWAVVVTLAATAASVSTAFAQPKPGQGSLGMRMGVPYFVADKDTRSGERPRLIFDGNFQYKMTSKWRFAAEFGFGWVGYAATAPSPYKLRDPDSGDSVSVKQDVLTKFQPINATLIRSLNPNAEKWSPYVGVGANITRMEIVNKRQVIKDPATFAPWVNWAFGGHGLIGTERWMGENKTVALDWSLRWTYLFSKDTKRFPSGFTGNDSYLTATFGVNVYFWPTGKPLEAAKGPEPTPAPEVAPEPAAPEAPAAPETPAPPDTTTPPPPPGSQGSLLLRAPATAPGHADGDAMFAITREKRTAS